MPTDTPAKPQSGSTTPSIKEALDEVAGSNPASERAEDRPSNAAVKTATDWFLSPNIETVASAYVPVNVAPAGQKEHLVDFKIQVVDRDVIRGLRKESEIVLSSGDREMDEMEANLKICLEGLIEPDIKRNPDMRVVAGQSFMDPADALRARFAYKPGLIDQIAAKVVQISGYNDSDVKEVKAAGN